MDIQHKLASTRINPTRCSGYTKGLIRSSFPVRGSAQTVDRCRGIRAIVICSITNPRVADDSYLAVTFGDTKFCETMKKNDDDPNARKNQRSSSIKGDP
jgi:hypothetical protein